MQYFDKNGKEIKAGMKILMEDGSIEMVYDTEDQYGNPKSDFAREIFKNDLYHTYQDMTAHRDELRRTGTKQKNHADSWYECRVR